jgi:hypothetical protein
MGIIDGGYLDDKTTKESKTNKSEAFTFRVISRGIKKMFQTQASYEYMHAQESAKLFYKRNDLARIFADAGIKDFNFVGDHANVRLDKPSQLFELQKHGYKPKPGNIGAIA